MKEPLWHGWATPEDVKKMMNEMSWFLVKNGYAFQQIEGAPGELKIRIFKKGEQLAHQSEVINGQ